MCFYLILCCCFYNYLQFMHNYHVACHCQVNMWPTCCSNGFLSVLVFGWKACINIKCHQCVVSAGIFRSMCCVFLRCGHCVGSALWLCPVIGSDSMLQQAPLSCSGIIMSKACWETIMPQHPSFHGPRVRPSPEISLGLFLFNAQNKRVENIVVEHFWGSCYQKNIYF